MGAGFESGFLALMPRLKQDVCDSLEASISVRDLEKVINELSPGKTPKPGDLGADFYKTCVNNNSLNLPGSIRGVTQRDSGSVWFRV